MKFYIAGRNSKRNEIKRMQNALINEGHQITVDWTDDKFIRPYSEHKELSEKYAKLSVDGVKQCDVFLIISDEAGMGMYVELGVAIALKKKVIVLGDKNSMFYFYPGIIVKDNFEEMLKGLWSEFILW